MSTVEELVLLIQKGDNLRNELYSAIYRYLYKLCGKYLRFASLFGWEFNDLLSVAWFGVERAIKDFNPDRGYKFITYLKYHINNSIKEFLGIRGKKQIVSYVSFEEEVPGTENLTFGDTIEDKSTAETLENIENVDYYKDLRNEVEKLLPNTKEVIKQYFFDNYAIADIADNLNISVKEVQGCKNEALNELRKSRCIKNYREEFAYSYIPLATFNATRTSSTERAALKTIRTENVLEELMLKRGD